jgi:riboflavin-specific deaminase-like protein
LNTNAPAVTDETWRTLLEINAITGALEQSASVRAFRIDSDGRLQPVDPASPTAELTWLQSMAWQSYLPADDPRSALLDLYLPICAGTASRPVTIGHLGQSLDGFIATHSGDSQFVTGGENLLHMHRLRALCDAVVVGAGTVAADDPQLTTRLVPGPSPVRVILDPTRRLEPTYRVFTDGQAPTLYACAASRIAAGETHVGQAVIVPLDDESEGREGTELVALLRARGHARIFVEGGGVTVSGFLVQNLLDRLHIAIAPVLIGDGRPAIRIARHENLRDCRRPSYRVFRMGGDVLFDCDLRGDTGGGAPAGAVSRVI